MPSTPTYTLLRALGGIALALTIGCAASGGGSPVLLGPSDSEVDALITDLETEVNELGAMGMDVSRLEQHLRMARVTRSTGDNAHAQQLATEGIELADGVRDRVDEIIGAELAQKDREIRIELASLEDYLREGWEQGVGLKLSQIEALVVVRNERAALTNGRFPEKTYAKKLDPIRRVVKDISESQVRTKMTGYKKSLGRPLAKLRGNELRELQDAMASHVVDNAYKAKKGYLAALRKQPENYKALQNLGILQMELGEYPEAATRLEKAFGIGLTLDEEDGEWYRDFLPDPDPLVAALKEIGRESRVTSVQNRFTARVTEVEALREEREAARLAALDEPEVIEDEGDFGGPATATIDEKCRQKPVAGKVQMIAEGMDTETVREIICSPESLKLADNRAYWYYGTGTVVFEDEKVIETSQQRLDP